MISAKYAYLALKHVQSDLYYIDILKVVAGGQPSKLDFSRSMRFCYFREVGL